MTPEEREQVSELRRQIQIEQNPLKFTSLVEELSRLLAQREERLRK